MTGPQLRWIGRPVRRGLVVGIVLVLVALPGCTERSDLAFFNRWVFAMPISEFVDWWKIGHAGATGLSPAVVEYCWHNRCLDSAAAKAGAWDLSTDFCSYSPDTGPHFDFKAACARHDFAWRNLVKMDQRWGGYDTRANRVATSSRFYWDMYDHCQTRAPGLRQACHETAELYYGVVLRVA